MVKHGEVAVLGARLHYVEAGGGHAPAVVFIHANTGTSESWLPQLAYFGNVGFRAIALDRQGWGRSRPDPATAEAATAPDWRGAISETDLLDAFLSALDVSACHLVATAGGAFAALDLAARPSSSLLSLTVIATLGPWKETQIRDFETRISVRALGRDLPAEVRELSAGYRGSDPVGTRRWTAIATSARNDHRPARSVGSDIDYATLRRITTPTLVVAGGADIISPPALMRMWTPQLGNAATATFHEAGHAAAWEKPKEFNDLLDSFISQPGHTRKADE